MRRLVMVSLALALGWTVEARAQYLPLEGKAFVDVNGLYQVHSQDLTQKGSFSLYDEQGTLDTKYGVRSGGAWDFSFGYRVWRDLSVGLGMSQFQKKGPATIAASVPHPLFYGRPRTASRDLKANHKERAISMVARWEYKVPDFDEITVAFIIGPAHLRVTQELAIAVATSETGVPYSSVNATPAVVGRTKSTIGVMAGVDGAYSLHPNFGIGLVLRYLGGSINVAGLGNEKVKVEAGGFQLGGGVRLRF